MIRAHPGEAPSQGRELKKGRRKREGGKEMVEVEREGEFEMSSREEAGDASPSSTENEAAEKISRNGRKDR